MISLHRATILMVRQFRFDFYEAIILRFGMDKIFPIKAKFCFEPMVLNFGRLKTHLEPRIEDIVVACHPTHSQSHIYVMLFSFNLVICALAMSSQVSID